MKRTLLACVSLLFLTALIAVDGWRAHNALDQMEAAARSVLSKHSDGMGFTTAEESALASCPEFTAIVSCRSLVMNSYLAERIRKRSPASVFCLAALCRRDGLMPLSVADRKGRKTDTLGYEYDRVLSLMKKFKLP